MNVEPSEIFKVLSVETRFKIIELLKSQGPMGAKVISATIGITTAAVSQHLKILKQAGLIRSERKGYWIPYSIDEKAMEKCRQLLTEVCTCGCQGTGGFNKSEPERSNLVSLKQYETELKNELGIVRQRLKELSTEKN
ncbi:MAG: winged helix-turn-helix transcriptional regulator [Desulfobacteraceae bacterium]|nr:winged helix-turn-helix transcriptional regulator [Desulfobacteraceae bacterium]